MGCCLIFASFCGSTNLPLAVFLSSIDINRCSRCLALNSREWFNREFYPANSCLNEHSFHVQNRISDCHSPENRRTPRLAGPSRVVPPPLKFGMPSCIWTIELIDAFVFLKLSCLLIIYIYNIIYMYMFIIQAAYATLYIEHIHIDA